MTTTIIISALIGSCITLVYFLYKAGRKYDKLYEEYCKLDDIDSDMMEAKSEVMALLKAAGVCGLDESKPLNEIIEFDLRTYIREMLVDLNQTLEVERNAKNL